MQRLLSANNTSFMGTVLQIEDYATCVIECPHCFSVYTQTFKWSHLETGVIEACQVCDEAIILTEPEE